MFEDDFGSGAIAPTAAATARGRVEPVTDLPSIGKSIIFFTTAQASAQHQTVVLNYVYYPSLGLEQQSSSGSSSSGRIKLAKTQKKSAINDFKERLKSRFQSFRNRANEASPRTSFR